VPWLVFVVVLIRETLNSISSEDEEEEEDEHEGRGRFRGLGGYTLT
jgi:hypothetical protein